MVKISEEAAQGQDAGKWLPRRIPDYRREEIQKCIQSFRSLPEDEWPDHHKSPPRKHITPAQKIRFDEIQKKRNQEAANLAIDPTIIASRATMVRLACEAEGVFEDVLPWQQQVLGFS
jgi:ribonuclease D